MIVSIGDIIIDKIKLLPFLDKYAGVVQVLAYKSTDKSGKVTKKTFPASCNVTFEQCKSGQYKDLCPDSTKKSVLYLEDNGIRFVKREGGRTYWKASLNLCCWLNMPNLGYSNCSYSAIAVEGILSKFPVTPFNSGVFTRTQINVVGQLSKTQAQQTFLKYTYDETVNQFMMYPYDFFVLLLEVDFVTDKSCLSSANINSPISCK